MSDALNAAYASNTDVILQTLQAKCDAWSGDVFICSGFTDESRHIENGNTVTYTAMDFYFTLPKRGKDGLQGMSFEFNKHSLNAVQKLYTAVNAKARVKLTVREYVGSALDPAAALTLYASSITEHLFSHDRLTLVATFDDNTVNKSFPTLKYNAQNTPGLVHYGR